MEHGQVESSSLHWGWDGDEARHWTLYALGGKDLTVLIKLCSEEPEIMTGTLGPLRFTSARAAKLLICAWHIADTRETLSMIVICIDLY